METCKPAGTPVVEKFLESHDQEKNTQLMEVRKYQQMIGSLRFSRFAHVQIY